MRGIVAIEVVRGVDDLEERVEEVEVEDQDTLLNPETGAVI